jgi:hypothetical protein
MLKRLCKNSIFSVNSQFELFFFIISFKAYIIITDFLQKTYILVLFFQNFLYLTALSLYFLTFAKGK